FAVIVENLDFIAAAQADAAVRVLDNAELDVRGEVPELLVGNDVGGRRRVLQNAVLHAPLHLGVGHERVPAAEVFAVEKLDGLGFLPRAIVLLVGKLGSADAGELDGLAGLAFADHRAFELAANEFRAINELGAGPRGDYPL